MNILKINSSANTKNSISRYMVDLIIEKLREYNTSAIVQDRDVAYNDLPYLNQAFVEGMFRNGGLNTEQKEALKLSDQLIDELKNNDVLVIGAPMYNFTIPSSLKSYFDLIARPGKTFNYTSRGEMNGLLKNKSAFIIISSGGTPIGGIQDHSSSYIKTFLNFIGISNIHYIDMDQAGFDFKSKTSAALTKVNDIINNQELVF